MAYSAPNAARAVGYVVTNSNWNELAQNEIELHGDGAAQVWGAASLTLGGALIAANASGLPIKSSTVGQVWQADANIAGYGGAGFFFLAAANSTQRGIIYAGAEPTNNPAGANWLTARAANASGLRFDGTTITFYGNSGLTPGNTFTPTTYATLATGGVVSGALAPRVTIPAAAFVPASTNGATLAAISTGSDKYELQFPDGASALTACAGLVVPSNYASGNITIKLYWYIAGASQQVYWNFLAANAAAGGAVNGTPASKITASATSNGTTNLFNVTTLTWSSSLPAAGDDLEIQVQRDPTQAWDTSTATANLRKVVVEFGS